MAKRRTHSVVECELYKEERVVLKEEMRELDDCDMEDFGTQDSSDKTVTLLEDGWRSQAAKHEGDKNSLFLFSQRCYKSREWFATIDFELQIAMVLQECIASTSYCFCLQQQQDRHTRLPAKKMFWAVG